MRKNQLRDMTFEERKSMDVLRWQLNQQT
jgi:hypothetical protein